MQSLRMEQLDVVVACSNDVRSDLVDELEQAGFRARTVTCDLDGIREVASVRPQGIVLVGLDDVARDWVLNFVEDSPNGPAILAVAEPDALEVAPEWLYDIVLPSDPSSVLAHRLSRAIQFGDMRRLSEARGERLGLSSAQLSMVSMVDVVTGLFNHRYFRKHLRESFAAARRYKRPLTLLLVRLESLEELLDALGEEPTNDILDCVALALTSVIRDADIAARIDTDLFGFLLPETTDEGAHTLLDRFVARLKKTEFPHPGTVRVATAFAQLEADQSSGNALLQAAFDKLPST